MLSAIHFHSTLIRVDLQIIAPRISYIYYIIIMLILCTFFSWKQNFHCRFLQHPCSISFWLLTKKSCCLPTLSNKNLHSIFNNCFINLLPCQTIDTACNKFRKQGIVAPPCKNLLRAPPNTPIIFYKMSNADNSAFTNQLPDHNAMELAASFKKYTSKNKSKMRLCTYKASCWGTLPNPNLAKLIKLFCAKMENPLLCQHKENFILDSNTDSLNIHF